MMIQGYYSPFTMLIYKNNKKLSPLIKCHLARLSISFDVFCVLYRLILSMYVVVLQLQLYCNSTLTFTAIRTKFATSPSKKKKKKKKKCNVTPYNVRSKKKKIVTHFFSFFLFYRIPYTVFRFPFSVFIFHELLALTATLTHIRT